MSLTFGPIKVPTDSKMPNKVSFKQAKDLPPRAGPGHFGLRVMARSLLAGALWAGLFPAAGVRAVAAADEIPLAKFTDVTKEAGITFTQNNGAYGDKLLPETLGGGVAFFDYDNEGRQDLLFINSTWWPGHAPDGKGPTTMALYHNDGHGHFTDVTAGSGLDVSFYGMGVAIGRLRQ